jgi:hypothetical protein
MQAVHQLLVEYVTQFDAHSVFQSIPQREVAHIYQIYNHHTAHSIHE